MGLLLLIVPAALLPEPAVLAVDLLADPAGDPAPDLASMLPPPEPPAPLVYPDTPPLAALADLLTLPAPETLPPPELTPRPPPVSPRPVARPQPRPAVAMAPAAPAATPGQAEAPAPAPAADRIAAWMTALGAWIDANRRYPPEARLRAEQGVATIRFGFDAEGRVTDAAIVTPSGSAALDAATLAMMQGARIPAPPEGLDPARRRVTVPIRYKLN